MDVLWHKGSASVQGVLDALPSRPALAYNSVLTTIRIREKKGYVKHVKDGRAHIYLPLIGRKEATRFEVRTLVSRLVEDALEELAVDILADQNIGLAELKRLNELLERSNQKP